MEIITHKAPFLWFDPRIQEGLNVYEESGPLFHILRASESVCGVLDSPDDQTVKVLRELLSQENGPKVLILFTLCAACPTRRGHLETLLELQARAGCECFRLMTSNSWGGAKSNVLCCASSSCPEGIFMIGPSPNLGMTSPEPSQVNFVFRGNSVLFSNWYHWFNWLWAKHGAPLAGECLDIPELVPAQGSPEADAMWSQYQESVNESKTFDDHQGSTIIVDSKSGEVTVLDSDGKSVAALEKNVGLKPPDTLAGRIDALLEQGSMVTVNKFSRMRPLDMPIKTEWFGVESLRRQGAVSREVKYRISVIDEKTLRSLENKRKATAQLLARLSFPLAEGVRWIPHAVKPLLAKEMDRIDAEGQDLLKKEMKGGAEAFVNARIHMIVKDANQMYQDFFPDRKLDQAVIDQIVKGLVERLRNAAAGQFVPELTFTPVGFSLRGESRYNSPWSQAALLLNSIAEFPRKVFTDIYFLRGLRTGKQELLNAMDVCHEKIVALSQLEPIENRANEELKILAEIMKSDMDNREKCKRMFDLMEGINKEEPK